MTKVNVKPKHWWQYFLLKHRKALKTQEKLLNWYLSTPDGEQKLVDALWSNLNDHR